MDKENNANNNHRKNFDEKMKKSRKSLTKYKNADLPVSSTAEYLTFIASSGEGSIEVRYQDENIWLTQKMMAEIFDVDRSVISKHLKKIFEDGELQENVVCAFFAHTPLNMVL